MARRQSRGLRDAWHPLCRLSICDARLCVRCRLPSPNESLSFGMLGSADRAIPVVNAHRILPTGRHENTGRLEHGRSNGCTINHHATIRRRPRSSPTTSPAPSSAPDSPSSRSTPDDASPPAASTGDPASSSPHTTRSSARRTSPSRLLTARPSPPRSPDAIPRPTSLSSR